MAAGGHIFEHFRQAAAEERGYGIEIGAKLNLGISAGLFQDFGRGLGGTTAIEVVLHDVIGLAEKGIVDQGLALRRAGQMMDGVVT